MANTRRELSKSRAFVCLYPPYLKASLGSDRFGLHARESRCPWEQAYLQSRPRRLRHVSSSTREHSNQKTKPPELLSHDNPPLDTLPCALLRHVTREKLCSSFRETLLDTQTLLRYFTRYFDTDDRTPLLNAFADNHVHEHRTRFPDGTMGTVLEVGVHWRNVPDTSILE